VTYDSEKREFSERDLKKLESVKFYKTRGILKKKTNFDTLIYNWMA